MLNNKDGTAAEGKFSKKKQTHPKERKEGKEEKTNLMRSAEEEWTEQFGQHGFS